MKKIHYLIQKSLISLFFALFSFSVAQAQSSTCDTCTELATLNVTTQDIDINTATTSKTLSTLVKRITLALFGTLPALGNGSVMAAFSIVPAVEQNRYSEQQSLLHTIETSYQGSNQEDATIKDNYAALFGNYLLQEEDSATSFNEKNASIASLYLDPSKATFYSDEQEAAAKAYIQLVTGTAMSNMRKPGSDWLTVSNDHQSRDRKYVRQMVTTYYTFSALQSAIADNFSYIYGLNKGEPMTGSLENYTGKSISESGVFSYLQLQKSENPEWYKQIAGMGIVGLLREQTILLGGCFLMLSRIEEDLRKILITHSAQASTLLIATQMLSDKLNQTPTQ